MADKISMGIGALGFSNTTFKRKFRYTLEFTNICGNQSVPSSFVKLASRPGWETDETEINHLNGKTWLPGKSSVDTISVTYYDVATKDMNPLYNWLASVYNFTDYTNLPSANNAFDYGATGILKLWDGCGNLIETWTLFNSWPKSVKFGDLDYGDSEIATIEITIRYDSITYVSNCPGFEVKTCCTPCGDSQKKPTVTPPPEKKITVTPYLEWKPSY